MLIGYARVSTADQDVSLQLDALTAAGCEKVFTDKASGTKANRDGLAEALAYAREGDSLVVWKLDRLGRSMKGLVDLAADLEARKVDLRSLTDGIDTRPLSIRAYVSKMLRLAGLPQRCVSDFLPPAFRRSSRDKKDRSPRPSLTLRADAAAPATG